MGIGFWMDPIGRQGDSYLLARVLVGLPEMHLIDNMSLLFTLGGGCGPGG